MNITKIIEWMSCKKDCKVLCLKRRRRRGPSQVVIVNAAVSTFKMLSMLTLAPIIVAGTPVMTATFWTCWIASSPWLFHHAKTFSRLVVRVDLWDGEMSNVFTQRSTVFLAKDGGLLLSSQEFSLPGIASRDAGSKPGGGVWPEPRIKAFWRGVEAGVDEAGALDEGSPVDPNCCRSFATSSWRAVIL